jgi:hypothetical protein
MDGWFELSVSEAAAHAEGFGKISRCEKNGSTTNPMCTVQIIDFAENITTSVLDPSPLMAVMIGLLVLDRLRGSLLADEFRKIHRVLQWIGESHPFRKKRRL